MIRVSIAALLIACSAVVAGAAEPDFIIGACTHRGTEGDYLPVLRQAGVMSNRDEISWGRCETVKGTITVPESYIAYVDRGRSLGLTTLNILDYANKFYDDGGYPRSPEAIEGFVRYSEAVVTALKGKSTLYQVWNEWDGGCGMPDALKRSGDAQAYVKLLAAVYPRIKAIDPSITVIANSVCTGDEFLKQTLALGVLKHCDALALHTYNYSNERTAEAWHQRMVGVDAFVRAANDGKPVPLYVTEMGWPNHISNSGSTQDYSAVSLTKLFLLARTLPYIKGVWWYDFRDDAWDAAYNENNFGLVRNDLTPKAPYFALKEVARLIDGATFAERLNAGDPDAWVLRFTTARGTNLVAAWNAKVDHDWQLTFAIPSAAKREVTLTSIGHGSVTRNFSTGKPDDTTARLAMSVRDQPLVLEGDLGGVTLLKAERKEFPESQRPVRGVFRKFGPLIQAAPIADAVTHGRAARFGNPEAYTSLIPKQPRQGAADLDATLAFGWEPRGLHLQVVVTDDIQRQEHTGDATWQGDGLQLAFHNGRPQAGILGHVDLDVALTASGPQVYRRFNQSGKIDGVATDIQAVIQRTGTTTTYDLTLPWAAVGLPADAAAGSLLGFSLLVNDDDGNGRKGFLHWGDGIGRDKDPYQYGWIQLGE